MKKFEAKNFAITHRTLVLCVLGGVLLVASMGIATAGICSHKFNEQKVSAISEMEEAELVSEKVPAEELKLPSINENSLPEIKAPKKVEEVVIQKFCAPLPKKYMSYRTSPQGLRDAISAKDTGGLSTSGKWHNGIDIACPDKTPVYATKDGYIAEVWPSYYNGPYKYKGHPAYGGLVIIKHFDYTISLYAHLSFTEVKEGDYVTAGKEIAWSGGVKGRRGSGTSTGPHLHYSMYLDMESFLEY
jgi:murein DD-endopeptidase MepM/ murein hydrolase activator NlpD